LIPNCSDIGVSYRMAKLTTEFSRGVATLDEARQIMHLKTR
jgi:hypothetical protein